METPLDCKSDRFKPQSAIRDSESSFRSRPIRIPLGSSAKGFQPEGSFPWQAYLCCWHHLHEEAALLEQVCRGSCRMASNHFSTTQNEACPLGQRLEILSICVICICRLCLASFLISHQRATVDGLPGLKSNPYTSLNRDIMSRPT